jgi:hypothetical protein
VTTRKLSTTDAFVVVDLDDAPISVGIVRTAPKVLVDGATWLARSQTYQYAVFGRKVSGASAGINAPVEAKAEAIAAFVAELGDGSWSSVVLDAGRGIDPSDLAGLRASDPRPESWWTEREANVVAGIVAAADRAAGGLDGRSVAVERFDGSAPALVAAFSAAGATVVEPGAEAVPGAVLHADVDVLVVGSKVGVIGDEVAGGVRARVIVPSGVMPVTAKALAVLRRADVVVLPDFVTTGGHLAAWPVGESPMDAATLVGDAIAAVLDHPSGPLLGACEVAESFLAGWATIPFGRPIA